MIPQYIQDWFWGIFSCLGAIAPLWLILLARSDQRARNAAIEQTWHARKAEEDEQR